MEYLKGLYAFIEHVTACDGTLEACTGKEHHDEHYTGLLLFKGYDESDARFEEIKKALNNYLLSKNIRNDVRNDVRNRENLKELLDGIECEDQQKAQGILVSTIGKGMVLVPPNAENAREGL